MTDATPTALRPTRRAVLAGSGIALALGLAGPAARLARAEATPLEPGIWLTIAPSGETRIVFPMTEMGQGSSTGLPLILAEELDADWDRVVVEQLDRDDRAYGNRIFGGLLYTAGSTAVMAYFDTLRLAGASARKLLIALAAREWGVPAARLATEPGRVVDPETGRALSYGELAALDDGTLEVPEATEADLKPRAAYRLVGQDVPRRDIPAKSRGAAEYAIDVRLPGMAYAAVARAPVEGERALAIDDAEARAMPGVIDVVDLPDGVAVVAERLETAFAARDALAIRWSEEAPARAFDDEAALEAYAEAAADAARDAAVWHARGDAAGAISAAARRVEAEYRTDHAYHAQLEPMACVARVEPDGKGAEVWAGTQTQTLTTATVTEVLGTTPDRVRLHMMTMGGSFGRRTPLMQEFVRDALLCARATGRAVKVVWTREDDLRHGWFRPAAVQRLTAGLDREGRVAGWRHRVATPSVIAYFNPVRWEQVRPNDIISMRGSDLPHYGVADVSAEHVVTERAARVIPWRAIGASYTGFAAEAFVDEVAAEAGRDPLALRRELLAENPRGRALLDRVTAMSDWDRPREDTALGLAFAGYGPTMVAGVVEVALDRETGRITVPRVWAAVDAGLVITPKTARGQVEGGILFGLSSALKERVTIRGGEVQQSNFWDYEILRMDEHPEIEIAFADVDAPPTGLGEAGTPFVPAAIANAVFAMTGRRLRHMPFTPDRVLAALG